ncbi:MAG: transposase, partial [Burkholderiales bacterium]
MPRRARLMLAGVPVHLIQRGNNRSICFYSEEDYAVYLHHLEELGKRFDCAIHAYVLMTNHVHLLLTPGAIESTGLLMKNLGQRYVQYINRTYKRSGTLWEGRFRSCLTQKEDYVLACYRYIELNPMRADMVKHPRDYRWSSYRSNGEGKTSTLLTPHAQYRRLGRDAEERQIAYRALFKTRLDSELLGEIRQATNGNYALGGKRFQAEIEAALG